MKQTTQFFLKGEGPALTEVNLMSFLSSTLLGYFQKQPLREIVKSDSTQTFEFSR